MAKGSITLYKGKSNKSGKPFTALMLEAGKFNKLIFLDSALELDYLENYLDTYVKPSDRSTSTTEPDSDAGKIDINSEDEAPRW